MERVHFMQNAMRRTFTESTNKGVIRVPLFSRENLIINRIIYEVMELLSSEGAIFPAFIVRDVAALHYLKWTEVVFNETDSFWARVLWNYFCKPEYLKLNSSTANNMLFAKYATYFFLKELLESEEKGEERREPEEERQLGYSCKYEEEEEEGRPQEDSSLMVIVDDLTKEADKIYQELSLYNSFSSFGIPVEKYSSEPEELRKILSSKIIVQLISQYRKAVRYPSFSLPKIPVRKGIPAGVKKIVELKDVYRMLPQDFADEFLFTYLVATRSARVREEYGGLQGYLIYVDKSGSMAEPIEGDQESIPKISFATASALALSSFLKRYGADFTLKFFDTEVHDEIRSMDELVKSLLTIEADSGTNITEVLRDAMKYGRERRIVVITDGIDEVDEEVAREASYLNAHFVFIKTTNVVITKYFKYTILRRVDPEILLKI